MINIFKAALSIAMAIMLALVAFTPAAYAEGASTRVVVPDRPQTPAGGGCYQIAERLYGPYTMNFCLTNRGSYRVTGGGLNCSGSLTWSVSGGRTINVRLQRTSCGRGKAWSADSMSCQGLGFLGSIVAKVVIPDVPGLSNLRCTYTPSVHSYMPVTVRALRIR